jgi:lipopolysaccharide export system permease protein
VTLNIFESSFFDVGTTVTPREMTSYDLGRQIKKMRSEPDMKKKTLNMYELEYSKKFSLPFGSLFFALLALPLAILFGRHNGQTIGLIAGLFISVIYWAMMILGQIFSSKTGTGGTLSMWLPDTAAGVAGILFYAILLRR